MALGVGRRLSRPADVVGWRGGNVIIK